MRDGLTWYKIYREFCNELDIIFPLKQSEISPRQNPIPNNLEFHKRNASKKEVNKNLEEISRIYYKIYRDMGETKFYELLQENSIYYSRCMEYPDRIVNLNTAISVLYLSGYRGDELYNKSKAYYERGKQK